MRIQSSTYLTAFSGGRRARTTRERPQLGEVKVRLGIEGDAYILDNTPCRDGTRDHAKRALAARRNQEELKVIMEEVKKDLTVIVPVLTPKS